MSPFARSITVGLGVVVLAGGLAAWSRARNRARPAGAESAATAEAPPAAPQRAANAALGAVNWRVNVLQAQVEGLQQQVAARTAATPPATHPAAALPERGDDPAKLVQVRYDAVFEAQPADPAWAPAERRVIADFFSSTTIAGMRLEALECRDSLCRVRLHFDDDLRRREFTARLGEPPFHHGAFYRAEPETGQFALFTAREGRALPRVDLGEEGAPGDQ
jgi:hypothetical protein